MINAVGISDYYRFYEDNNRNGLKYNITIDNAIIDLLKNENGIIGSSELRSRIKESMGRKISPDTFYSHLNVLVNHKILNRQDEGRGKGVLYSLTKNAKRMLELNLLGADWERINLFRRIYEKFFLYEVLHDPLFILRSEQEFDRFLFDLGVKRQNLEGGRISEGRNYDSVDLIYGQNRDFPAKTVPKNLVKKYWRERKGQTSISEKIEFICFPLQQHNLDVVIYRREYWRINKNSPSGIERIDYTVTLPGVSIHELANDNSHHDFPFERTDIEKAFEQLKQTHLIDRAFWFRGHMKV